MEPSIPANLGFVARVLANAGLTDWVRVGGCDWRGSEAERTGAMARDRLEGLRVAGDLAEAVAGCSHLLGFTARSGRRRQPRPLPDLARLLAEWGPAARVGLVFGREDRGLEAEEAEACTALVTIPTAGLASLNLSHAVAVALYEWRRAAGPAPAPPPPEHEEVWASAEDRLRLARHAAAELAAAGFPDRGGELPGTLRRLAALPVLARDLRMLERIVRHARWRREHDSPGA